MIPKSAGTINLAKITLAINFSRDIIKSCGFKDSKGAYPPLKYYCLENIIKENMLYGQVYKTNTIY